MINDKKLVIVNKNKVLLFLKKTTNFLEILVIFYQNSYKI